MELSLFLLPTLGGYLFVTSANRFRFTKLRQSGYHVAFGSASAGLLLFVASFCIVSIDGSSFPVSWVDELGDSLTSSSDADKSATSAALLSAVIGWPTAIAWNCLSNGFYALWTYTKLTRKRSRKRKRRKQTRTTTNGSPTTTTPHAQSWAVSLWRKVSKDWWGAEDNIVRKSVEEGLEGRNRGAILAARRRRAARELLVSDAQELGNLIEVTLRSNKVYIGWVLDSGIARRGVDHAELALLPVFSGYRDGYGELMIKWSYVSHLAAAVSRNDSEQQPDDSEQRPDDSEQQPDQDERQPDELAQMRIAVALADVLTVRFFDLRLYNVAESGSKIRSVGPVSETDEGGGDDDVGHAGPRRDDDHVQGLVLAVRSAADWSR